MSNRTNCAACGQPVAATCEQDSGVRRDVGGGFFAVPFEAVTLNGMPLAVLNRFAEPYSGPWCLIAPNGRAVDDETGRRPHRYWTIAEAEKDAALLQSIGDWSTCG